MNFIKKRSGYIAFFVIPMVLALISLHFLIPAAKPILGHGSKVISKEQKQLLNFVAIGDSLTEGVGDTTLSGGYVPLLKQALTEETGIDAINVANFGKAGDRSDQILKRVKKSKDLQKALRKADFITLTVGGNDLMKVVKSEFMNDISYETFDKPRKKFQTQLSDLLKEIRKYNPDAPIYQMGIYNPFYLNFQEVTEMQDIVTLWNDTAKKQSKAEKSVYFIPINDLLYKGLDGHVGIGSEASSDVNDSSQSYEDNSGSNNLISEIDNFHPNNLGYQIMANAFQEKMSVTKNDWLEK